ncbi:MAG: penicillin-binding protein 1C [Bacteroidetes bacterium]|nr:penicillin-binding protein 1C [Bacteroidota bacterium]
MAQFLKRKKRYLVFIFCLLFVLYWFSLPKHLFTADYSTVMVDENHELLSAQIAQDGQWRFPINYDIPSKFEKCILAFEDNYFYKHPGINPISLSRALVQNIKRNKIVSGGSTITMQVIRLSRKNRNRTFVEKCIEFSLATRLELSYSKKEILALYCAHAPFGGNTVGLSAAAWRYFGRKPEQLSWGEAATLAVLPNSPALIYPGKNQKKLLVKRNRLLKKLQALSIIDAETANLAMQEPLPTAAFRMPNTTQHLLNRAINDGLKGTYIHATIDAQLQKNVQAIVEQHHSVLKGNQINNAAAIVLNTSTGNVLAYVGNVKLNSETKYGNDVDIISSPRSTGSILKPFLLASCLSDGQLLVNSLIPDVPTQIGSYSPKNFTLDYEGAVPAKLALARSLNVPAVKLLQTYGVDRFSIMLRKLGMTTLTKPSSHYGLSLILGGAEANLWDVVGMYSSMGRIVSNYAAYGGKYSAADIHPPTYINKPKQEQSTSENYLLDAASIKLTFDAMVEAYRPEQELNWQLYGAPQKVAWKTGTSYGFRDGWCVGVTPTYVIGVWVGNASGEGRAGLTGILTAAPIMFDILKKLPPTNWFEKPHDAYTEAIVCKQSGYLASQVCNEIDTIKIQRKGIASKVCPYHITVHLDKTEKWQVTNECEPVENMVSKPWFVLPPSLEYFYKLKHPTYSTLPNFRPDCKTNAEVPMELVYPKQASKIFIPIDLKGEKGKVVFEVAHRNNKAKIFWHIDEQYIASTSVIHQIAINPTIGEHELTILDDNGFSLSHKFEIIGKQ